MYKALGWESIAGGDTRIRKYIVVSGINKCRLSPSPLLSLQLLESQRRPAFKAVSDLFRVFVVIPGNL